MLKMKMLVDSRVWQMLLLGFFMSQSYRSSAAEEVRCSKPADIYFVLDASSSIWGPDFKKQLAFVNSIIEQLQLDQDAVRCGLITYGNIVQKEFGLDTYAGRRKATNVAVTSVRQLRGDTRTDMALQHMRKLMLAEAREGVPRIAIVMTDGQSDYPKLTQDEAELAHKEGITTFAIGIGNRVDVRELQGLASDADYLFTVDSFDALSAVKIMLSEKACAVQFAPPPVKLQQIEGCQYEPADIVFVLDASTSVWVADFKRLLSFVKDLVEVMSISSERVRFGVLTYGNAPKEQIQLDQYSTTSDLTKAISQIVHQRGGTNTAAALRHLRQQMFTGTRQRDGVQKIAVLVTDGPSDSPKATAQQAELVHKDDIRVFAIGVGKDVYMDELETIATQPSEDNVFTVDGYDTLGSLTAQLASKTCKMVAALERKEDVIREGGRKTTDRGDDIAWEGARTATRGEGDVWEGDRKTTKGKDIAWEGDRTATREEGIVWEGDRSTTKFATTTTTTTLPKTTTTTTTTPTPTTATPTTTTTPKPPPAGCGEMKPADIVFALPSTANSHQTTEAVQFIRSVADRMRVQPKGVHVGLVPRSCLTVPGFTLEQGSDKNQALRMFGGNHKSSVADTGSTIKYLRSVSFRPESGARPNTRKIGVLIVDRPLKNFGYAVDEAILAKKENIDLVVIGVGKDVSVDELRMLASSRSPHHSVMTVPRYEHLKQLTRKLAFTADQFCRAN